jgi:hypothetical protein
MKAGLSFFLFRFPLPPLSEKNKPSSGNFFFLFLFSSSCLPREFFFSSMSVSFASIYTKLAGVDALVRCTNADLRVDIAFAALDCEKGENVLIDEIATSGDMRLLRASRSLIERVGHVHQRMVCCSTLAAHDVFNHLDRYTIGRTCTALRV